MAVAIQSIMDNADMRRLYQIFVLYTNISDEYKTILANRVKDYDNFSIEYIDVAAYVKEYTFYNTSFSIEAYYRLLIPYIFGRYERVIYLDCDIICLEDIAKIISPNPDDSMIDGVRDIGFLGVSNKPKEEYAIQLGLKTARDYFCSGVLVFNTAVFAKTITQHELFGKAALRNIKYPDQDILNMVCAGRARFLDMAWDVLPDDGRLLAHPFDQEYETARRHPYIIHYGGGKPWFQFSTTSRNKLFWQYAWKTPFIDIILNKADFRQNIYNGIRKEGKYGPRFLVKCGGLWLIQKLKKCCKLGNNKTVERESK
jgi:lipopolysaccharide biosynthesis glycosyltransferase